MVPSRSNGRESSPKRSGASECKQEDVCRTDNVTAAICKSSAIMAFGHGARKQPRDVGHQALLFIRLSFCAEG
jgi:hypothetical protein